LSKKKTYDKDDPNKPLSDMEKKFVEAYSGNGEQAAIQAGYSPKTAKVQGSRLLTRVNVITAIKSREEKPRAFRIATREERQAFWTNVMHGNEKDIAYEKGVKIEVDVKMSDRLKAAELLGRSEADFTDNLKHSGIPNVVIKDLTGK
jgi:phage terminase small subunit